jgi:Uma2 family endonuclease
MSSPILVKEEAKTVRNGHVAPYKNGGSLIAVKQAAEELTSAAGLHISEEIYWEKYYNDPDFSYEWNNGVLEVRPMSNPLQYTLYEWFVILLHEFLKVHPVARPMALEMGVRLVATQHKSIRKPDLFLVRNDNPLTLRDHDQSYRGVCDLCIESISTSNKKEIERDTKTKKREYAAAGVREYFILDANAVYTAFYYLTPQGNYAEIKPDVHGVIRSAVLPGFQFRIADLYRRPASIDLVEDEVYRGFIMLEYQAEKQRAEQADARAEQERARAEALAAELRALRGEK